MHGDILSPCIGLSILCMAIFYGRYLVAILSSIFIKTPVATLYLGNGGTWKHGGGSSSTDGEGPHFTQKWVPIFTKPVWRISSPGFKISEMNLWKFEHNFWKFRHYFSSTLMLKLMETLFVKLLCRTPETVRNFALNPIQGGGGTMCPPCHVFAYTQVDMRTRVLIFCDFSSFLVWKRLQDFRLKEMSPFSQEK